MQGRRLGLVLVVVSAVSFGGVGVLGKLLLSTGMSVSAILFWRWAIAGALFAPVSIAALRRRPTRALAPFAVGFVGYAGTSGVFMLSLYHIPASLASFLLFLNPVFVALLSTLVLKEALGLKGYAALALSVSGLGLLTFAPGVDASLVGVALGLASAVLYAVTIVSGRRVVSDEAPLPIAGVIMAGAATAFAASGFATGTWSLPQTSSSWLHVVLLGVVSTAVSIGTFYLALPLIGAARASLVSALEPVSTLVVAFVVLGEILSALQMLGAVLILTAVALLATEREASRVAPQPIT